MAGKQRPSMPRRPITVSGKSLAASAPPSGLNNTGFIFAASSGRPRSFSTGPRVPSFGGERPVSDPLERYKNRMIASRRISSSLRRTVYPIESPVDIPENILEMEEETLVPPVPALSESARDYFTSRQHPEDEPIEYAAPTTSDSNLEPQEPLSMSSRPYSENVDYSQMLTSESFAQFPMPGNNVQLARWDSPTASTPDHNMLSPPLETSSKPAPSSRCSSVIEMEDYSTSAGTSHRQSASTERSVSIYSDDTTWESVSTAPSCGVSPLRTPQYYDNISQVTLKAASSYEGKVRPDSDVLPSTHSSSIYPLADCGFDFGFDSSDNTKQSSHVHTSEFHTTQTVPPKSLAEDFSYLSRFV